MLFKCNKMKKTERVQPNKRMQSDLKMATPFFGA